MYHCKKCDAIFTIPDSFYIETDKKRIKQIDVCPCCQYEDIEEKPVCYHCGEIICDNYIKLYDGRTFCIKCFDIIKNKL